MRDLAKTMAFLPELKTFLKTTGSIYTVRMYEMSGAFVEVEGVGSCRRISLGEVYSKEDLIPYVQNSGFTTLEAWWSKIKFFIAGSKKMYLYKVKLNG